MTNEETIGKLIEMRLTAMANAFREQMNTPDMVSLSFEERLGLLTDIEWTSRKNNRLKKLIHTAGFDQPQAHIADINYMAQRKLDQALIARLAACTYIDEKHNVIIMGATGSGKSYFGCALGMEACKRFYSVRYIRLPDLLTDLAIARGEGTIKKVLGQYQKVNLLILDEWMLVSLKESEARDLLEIIHSRHKKASTIFCSQFAPAGWHAKIGEATLADAILDRIVYDSYIIEIHSDGDEPSMREVYGIKA
ncbi:MAG: IS21-like element helper ATPase IstB [Dehalococcoidales bacterium]|nr:IS21-like element helper ATPase IstB [Dehalococcoidales bacterium]